MPESMKESDCKVFRHVRVVALDRLCRRILDEISEVANGATLTNHERYLKIFTIIHERDQTIGRLFNDPRRSNALLQLLAIQSSGLLTPEESERFSQETRDFITRILG